jgi:Tol biopolymer transport system component
VLPTGGGPARRLTDDLQDATRPAWSPDGRTIAFQSYRDGNFHLWTVRPDGSGLAQHTSGPHDHREPRWLPDGSGLVFSSDRAGTYDLYLLDLATGGIRAVTEGPGEDGEPTVSPDGARVAFTVDATRIDEVVLAGGARRTLVPPSEGSSLYGPSYSPGSGRLAHVRLTGARSDLVVDGKQVTQERDVFALPPSWLSDDELVYTADGRVWRQLVDGPPDEIAFTAVVPVQTRRPEPRPVDLDSPDARQALGIASPVASRDGHQITFRALNALWTADLAGAADRAASSVTGTSAPTRTSPPTAAAWCTPATRPVRPTCGCAT